jgi:hypothetical protein
MKFVAKVVIECKTKEEAEQVIAERLAFDEDYGFDYTLDWYEVEEVTDDKPTKS